MYLQLFFVSTIVASSHGPGSRWTHLAQATPYLIWKSLAVCGLVVCLIPGAARADQFADDLVLIQGLSSKQIGLMPIIKAYEKVIADFPTHPDRAKAMYALANAWQGTDKEKEIEWLRKATAESRKETQVWFDARIRLVGETYRKQPKEANKILDEVIEHAPDAVEAMRALYSRQRIALYRDDLVKAELICDEMQELEADPKRMPKETLRKGDVFSWRQSGESTLIMAWAQADVPIAERKAKINALVEKYHGGKSVVLSAEQAFQHMEKVEEMLRESNEKDNVAPPASTKSNRH